MAGDWIKIEKATLVKPEVLAISEMLEIHPIHSFGLCVKFWMWCDDQLTDGNAKSVTKVTLDYVIGCDGMTNALIKVGWLRDRSGSLEVPHFDRHLSECAKNRALTKERVRKSKEKGNAKTVTEVTQKPLLEKRREEKRREVEESRRREAEAEPTRKHGIPTLAEVKTYGESLPIRTTTTLLDAYFDTMESNGWLTKQGHPIADWRAALRRYASVWNEREAANPTAKKKGGSPDGFGV